MSHAQWLLLVSLQLFLWAELKGGRPIDNLGGWVFLALALLESFTPP